LILKKKKNRALEHRLRNNSICKKVIIIFKV
jgi:hypothetical protein